MSNGIKYRFFSVGDLSIL